MALGELRNVTAAPEGTVAISRLDEVEEPRE